jgi:myo-inositol-1(or 4)-monophosphatase
MPDPTMQELLDAIQTMARQAGAIIMEHYRDLRPAEIEFKGRRDLVSVADRASERFLTEEIGRRFPGHRVLGEEFGGGQGGGDWLWSLDPLDGTTNFVHGHPIFCVSIAAARRGRLIAGAVYAPVFDDLFTAVDGGGAERNGDPIRVSLETDLSKGLLATGFPYALNETEDNNLGHFARLALRTQAIRRCGAAALDLAWVASGIYDGFWEMGLHPWDMAAGALLVREAGGRVTDFEGGEGFLDSGRIVATNGALHGSILAALREDVGGAGAPR